MFQEDVLHDLPRKQSQGLTVQPACSSSRYLSCPLWRWVQHLPFSSHQGSPFISMNIQSDLDISVISLNTHQCSPWDPKGVWYAQESKQSKLGKVFWVQRHGGEYRDACEEWSNVKLGHGGIFLLVFVSVSLLIIRWEFNLLLPSELLELHFRFSVLFSSMREQGLWVKLNSCWLVIAGIASCHSGIPLPPHSLCRFHLLYFYYCHPPFFFKCLPLYHF